jgi:sigma-B regulation protein RsbU (phosphoserine phosphatase)
MGDSPKILIVDDEPFNVDYLEQELEDLDYETVSAFNGREALERVAAETPDVILLDIMMPIMDGFAVLEQLKAEPDWRNIPVIIISAMTDMESIIRGIALGAEEYLPKPFNEVLLQARIEASLEKKRWRDQEQTYLAEIEAANQKITSLNERLKAKNLRMQAELAVTQRLQKMLLPTEQELQAVPGLEIAAYMNPAAEVGGDYYDVLQHNGRVKNSRCSKSHWQPNSL